MEYKDSYFTLFHATTKSINALMELLVLGDFTSDIRLELQEEISRLTLAQIEAENQIISQSQ